MRRTGRPARPARQSKPWKTDGAHFAQEAASAKAAVDSVGNLDSVDSVDSVGNQNGVRSLQRETTEENAKTQENRGFPRENSKTGCGEIKTPPEKSKNQKSTRDSVGVESRNLAFETSTRRGGVETPPRAPAQLSKLRPRKLQNDRHGRRAIHENPRKHGRFELSKIAILLQNDRMHPATVRVAGWRHGVVGTENEAAGHLARRSERWIRRWRVPRCLYRC